MERALYINNFRNIGCSEETRIVLNNSLKKGEMGNLVILIGANNSGKSNVLDAISAFGKKSISKNDVTDLFTEEVHFKPSLSLCCKDDKDVYSVKSNTDAQSQR